MAILVMVAVILEVVAEKSMHACSESFENYICFMCLPLRVRRPNMSPPKIKCSDVREQKLLSS